MDLDVIFAYVVGVLAALAVIGALLFVVLWEAAAIRRAWVAYRSASRLRTVPSGRKWQ
jgi:hypothetical protein